MLWAAEGQFDNVADSNTHASLHTDGDVMHHVIDEHHDGHECHMSAHLVGLNSQELAFNNIVSNQVLPYYKFHLISYRLPPPFKPPRV